MRTATLVSAGLLATLCLVPTSAQPPQQRQGGPRGGGGGGQQGMNQRGNQNRAADAGNQALLQNGMNQNAMNQGGQQQDRRPSAEQVAQMMLANYDADGSGALDQQELQSALTAMMQQMQQQRSRQASQMNQSMQQSNANQATFQTSDPRTQRSGPPQRGGNGRSSGRQSRR